MLEGCIKSKNDLVMFLDADLVDLTNDNITQLVKPLLNGSVDMTIGMVKHDSRLSIIPSVFGHGSYSGQRAMKKEIAIQNLKKVNGYSAEAIMNEYVLKNNLKFIIINWLNVKAIIRFKKLGTIASYRSLTKTFKEIFIVVSPFKFIKQLIVMRKLSTKYEKDIKNV